MTQHLFSSEALEALQIAESRPVRAAEPLLRPAEDPRPARRAPPLGLNSRPTKPTYRKRQARAKAKAARQARRANRGR